MQPNQVLGIVLLKSNELCRQRFMWGLFVIGVARILIKKSLGLRHQGNCHLAKSRTNCASLRELVVKFEGLITMGLLLQYSVVAVMETLQVHL